MSCKIREKSFCLCEYSGGLVTGVYTTNTAEAVAYQLRHSQVSGFSVWLNLIPSTHCTGAPLCCSVHVQSRVFALIGEGLMGLRLKISYLNLFYWCWNFVLLHWTHLCWSPSSMDLNPVLWLCWRLELNLKEICCSGWTEVDETFLGLIWASRNWDQMIRRDI